MDWAVLLYLLPYIISLIVSVGVGTYAWRRREVAGARAYAWVTFSQASWILGYILELLSPGLGGKIFWDNFQFIGGGNPDRARAGYPGAAAAYRPAALPPARPGRPPTDK